MRLIYTAIFLLLTNISFAQSTNSVPACVQIRHEIIEHDVTVDQNFYLTNSCPTTVYWKVCTQKMSKGGEKNRFVTAGFEDRSPGQTAPGETSTLNSWIGKEEWVSFAINASTIVETN